MAQIQRKETFWEMAAVNVRINERKSLNPLKTLENYLKWKNQIFPTLWSIDLTVSNVKRKLQEISNT